MTSPIIWQFAADCIAGSVYRSQIEIRNTTTLKFLLIVTVAFVVWQYMSRLHAGHGVLEYGLTLIPLMLVAVLASKRMPMMHPAL